MLHCHRLPIKLRSGPHGFPDAWYHYDQETHFGLPLRYMKHCSLLPAFFPWQSNPCTSLHSFHMVLLSTGSGQSYMIPPAIRPGIEGFFHILQADSHIHFLAGHRSLVRPLGIHHPAVHPPSVHPPSDNHPPHNPSPSHPGKGLPPSAHWKNGILPGEAEPFFLSPSVHHRPISRQPGARGLFPPFRHIWSHPKHRWFPFRHGLSLHYRSWGQPWPYLEIRLQS